MLHKYAENGKFKQSNKPITKVPDGKIREQKKKFEEIIAKFFIIIMFAIKDCVCALSHPVMSDSANPMDCSPPGFSVHGDSPGKNIGVGCHALLQGIFPTHGLNPGLPHCRRILHGLSH